MIKVNNQLYNGDAQVLSGFFEFHKAGSVPHELTQHPEDHLYRRATVDVVSIRYILRQRGWKLPIVTFEQTESLVSRLKSNSSADYYGLTSEYIKYGGSVSISFLTEYLNLSFQFIESGVPEEELLGRLCLIYKGNNKDLTNPKSFRPITVCALLGQLKEMAVCDLTVPILRPLKPKSQLGFTPQLSVKMANILVTEKRGLALATDTVVLH